MLYSVKKKSAYVETILPVDHKKEGPILADELYQTLLCTMPPKTMLTCIMNTCHGGSVIQLPYCYIPNNSNTQISCNDCYDFEALIGLAIVGGIVVAAGSAGGGNSGGGDGGTGGGTGSGASSENGDDCYGGCCEGLFEALFE